MLKKRTAKGIDYLLLAFVTFAGMMTETLYMFLLEPAIYGCPRKQWNVSQNVCHWILTCITWGLIAFFVIRFADKKFHFNLFEDKGKIKAWQWVAAAACVALVLVVQNMDWHGSKVISEFRANGVTKFIFQYLYYCFETLLIMLVIIFAQKAFEVWFKKENIPYGGIILALTWGLIHWATKANLLTGLLAAAGGFCFGVVYLLLNRNIKLTYLALCMMFIL